MSQIESKESQPINSWIVDGSISTRRFENNGEEFVIQRQKLTIPDGSERAREILEVKKVDGTVEAYVRTDEHPAYSRIPTGSLIQNNQEEE